MSCGSITTACWPISATCLFPKWIWHFSSPRRCDRVVKCVTSVIWPHRCPPRSGMSRNPLIKTEGLLFENRIYWTNVEVDPALVSLPSQACLQNYSSYITICVSASESLSPLTFVPTQSLCEKETLPPPSTLACCFCIRNRRHDYWNVSTDGARESRCICN